MFVAAARNSVEEQKKECDSSGTWAVGSRTSSIWLSYIIAFGRETEQWVSGKLKKGGRTLAGRAKKEGQLVDMVGDLSLSPETPPRRKRIGSKEMSEEERLPGERWRRVGYRG